MASKFAAILMALVPLVHLHSAAQSQILEADTFKSRAAQADEVRLRVVLLGRDATAERQVRVGAVAVCSEAACYRTSAQQFVDLAAAGSGESRIVMDVLMPAIRINRVTFETSAGQKVIEGQIALAQPFQIVRDYPGVEVLVVLEKAAVKGGGVRFVPNYATASPFSDSRMSIYYDPEFPLSARFDLGVALSLPRAATLHPQIFSVAVHDTGDQYPLVDIFPEMTLRSSAELTLPELVRQPRALRSDQSPDAPRPAPPSKVGSATTARSPSGGTRAVPFTRTGVMRSGMISSNDSQGEFSRGSGDAVWWSTCAQVLSDPQSEPIFARDLAITGTIQLNWCETVPPYVHITITNLRDPREVVFIPSGPKAFVNNIWQTPLRRITTWAPNTQVLVNGFTWEGDSGVSGGYGRPLGFVTWWNGTSNYLGSNRSGGGTWFDYPGQTSGTGAGNKLVMYKWPVTSTDFSWAEDSSEAVYFGTAISSSTSVVKSGGCSGDATANRWSAIGTTAGGRLIIMSSTSGSTTSARDMCPSFRSLGVSNALRLDGGPSAGMTIDGVLKNPLTGVNGIVFGPARSIPYPFKVSYRGW